MFQPAEEGMGGAEKMIEDGVLENPKVDVALALHVWNEKPVGWIGISAGPVMAGAEIFKIKVHGKGGHGACTSSGRGSDPGCGTDYLCACKGSLPAISHLCKRQLSVSALSTAASNLTSSRPRSK